ncbi:hypothetical protein M3Y94_01259100 [Aphelenchoides besseyi]|nr:hypothetical protein M3Y94_01259100 [Aphelenchoides besseyi]KAI6222525.1 hypothetical protein M3Y95_00902700 [Aphelenchoides besseyi]
MPDGPIDDICPSRFAWECKDESCCASYHMRVMMLFFSLAVFALALIVFVVWFAVDFRPSRRRNSQPQAPRDKRALSEVEIKSFEETRYLRRMSELNPNARREYV